jgi:hypothetical protein
MPEDTLASEGRIGRGLHQKPEPFCRLCQKDKELMNSHILPEFIYKPLYDDKHRFYIISTYEQRGRAKEQKGIRERLLCLECEQHISRYENYARKVLFGGVEIAFRNEREGIVLSGIDYELFKLFQLSVLWRASVCSHKMFENVALGPHESTIQHMILANEPGPIAKYCCVMMAMKLGGDSVSDLIEQPERRRLKGRIVYRFTFGSIAWIYFVCSHGIPRTIRDAVLSETGTVRMAIRDIRNLGCISGFFQDAERMGRLPKG